MASLKERRTLGRISRAGIRLGDRGDWRPPVTVSLLCAIASGSIDSSSKEEDNTWAHAGAIGPLNQGQTWQNTAHKYPADGTVYKYCR
nr:unnamed protein product [Digitaria exilis]